MTSYWFRRGRWGWQPIHWRGWLLQGVFIALGLPAMVAIVALDFEPPAGLVFSALMILVLAVNVIAILKTEKP